MSPQARAANDRNRDPRPNGAQPEPRFGDAAWWATGIGLVPLLIVVAALAYALVGSLIALVAAPFLDLPLLGEGDGRNLVVDAYFLGAIGLVVVGLPYMALGTLLLAGLRLLTRRGWTGRRLRRLAVIAGIVATAPFVVFVPAGALYGMAVPLPGAGAEQRHRVLARACAGLAALTVLLVPLSFIAE